jgi:putative sterol carrier protein
MSQLSDILNLHRRHIDELEGFDGSVRFDLGGEGSWFFSVKNGDVSMEQSRRDAECVVVCEPEEFVRLATGKANLVTAVMQGRVQLYGTPIVAKKLHGVWLRTAGQQS